MMTTDPEPERVAALAALFHEQQIGCKTVPSDPFDHGMPWRHTGDHEAVARAILTPGPIRQIDGSAVGSAVGPDAPSV